MTCPKKFEFTLPTLCLTSLPSRIFKSSVFRCNSFAVGKAIRRFDTTAPLLTSISRKPWYRRSHAARGAGKLCRGVR